jgi:hypothetical protein
MNNKWWINDKRKQRSVEQKLDRADPHYDKYERISDKTIDQFDALVSRAYLEAKGRSSWACKELPFEEAGKAVRLIMKVLGKKPDINYNKDMRGRWMRSRHVLWGVNISDGIEVCNALVAAGIKDFWITTADWLTIEIPREIFVTVYYCPEDDPLVWAKRQGQREDAAKIREVGMKLDGKVA